MSKIKSNKTNYSGTDDYLIDIMYDRGLYPPFDGNGKLNRKFAISRLQEWEAVHGTMDSAKVRVKFRKSMSPSAGNYVFASINEKAWQIPYDVEVVVPEYLLRECIDRAITRKRIPVIDDTKGWGVTYVESEVKVYPYDWLGYVEEGDDSIEELIAA